MGLAGTYDHPGTHPIFIFKKTYLFIILKSESE